MRQLKLDSVTIQMLEMHNGIKKCANFARKAKFINMILAYYLLTVLCGRWIAVTNGILRTALAGDAFGFRRRLGFRLGFNKRCNARLNIGAI
jgi:hypothetical protein